MTPVRKVPKATKTANIYATLYEGDFAVNFDCGGVLACRFALCYTMPPDGTDECMYRDNGSCVDLNAKLSALESFQKKIAREIKQLEDGINDR